MRIAIATAALAALASLSSAQNRVVVAGTPTNLLLDMSQTTFAVDAMASDAFYVLLPLSEIGSFARWQSISAMDGQFGTGNWLTCELRATHWAYISDDTCAHQAPPGGTAPMSLLTTHYDYGGYSSPVGTPGQPFPNSTLFLGMHDSYANGRNHPLVDEVLELRTRGWNPTDFWNGCGSSSLTPSFQGFLIARFTFTLN